MGQANGALLVVFGTKKGDILLEWVIWGSGKLQCEAFIGPRRYYRSPPPQDRIPDVQVTRAIRDVGTP